MALGGALGLAWSPVTPVTPRHFAWQAWHNQTSTFVLRGRRGTNSHPPSFCVAGVALMALGGALGLAWSPVTPVTPRHFAWQAWHKLTSTVVLRGRRGTHGTGWRAWTGLVARDARDAAALCVAGVAQPHIHLRFAWQACHNRTSTIVSRGRRGTHGTVWRAWTGLVARDARDAAALCVAGVAQTHIHRRFAWQAWHVLRGRRGTTSHPPSFCVAGVALMALGGALGLAWSPVTPVTPRHFAWQAWHKLTSTVVLRGRRVTTSQLLSFCVAGVALMALGGVLGLAWSPVTPVTPRHFAWQAWHNLTSTVVLRGRRGTTSQLLCHNRTSTVVLRGRHGTHGTGWRAWTGLVARDAVTPWHFAWQAWHKLTSTVVLRGRRVTTSQLLSFCVAGVALMALGGVLGLAWSPVTPVTPRHFAWQAWHNLTSTVVLRGRRGTTSQLLCHNRTSTVVLRGRRGTHGTGWRAWTGLVARDARDAAALCVAGVAQTHIHRRFAWQACHNLTATVVLRGRRGTHGTGWRAWTGLVARDARDAAALCVAGVAQPHIHRRFAWQAWHNLTATVSQSNIHRRFAWQAWHSWHWVARLDWLGRP